MQKQKRGFWLFIFSLIPGAGEMYMGFKTQEEHYWTPYRPYQQNVPNMETDAVKNTTDTVNPDCCTDIDVTDTANNKSPVSLKKDFAAEVSQEDASSQTTNSES